MKKQGATDSSVLTFLSQNRVAGNAAEVRVGVSTCLLGERVRYNGKHKYDPFINERLAKHIKLVPMCPEVEIGLGTPREPLDLVLEDDGIHLRGAETGRDFTVLMQRYADAKARELAQLGLCGFIFKSKSPSCGLDSVRVRSADKGADGERAGRGLFAAAVLSTLPWLPVEESSRFQVRAHRERFLERVFALRRLRVYLAGPITARSLREFHSNESFLLLSQGGDGSSRLQEIVESTETAPLSKASGRLPESLVESYGRLYLEIHGILSGAPEDPSARRRRQAEVLKRLAACVQGTVPDETMDETLRMIEEFDRGVIDRSVPLLRLREAAREHRLRGLAAQSFLNPFPEALAEFS